MKANKEQALANLAGEWTRIVVINRELTILWENETEDDQKWNERAEHITQAKAWETHARALGATDEEVEEAKGSGARTAQQLIDEGLVENQNTTTQEATLQAAEERKNEALATMTQKVNELMVATIARSKAEGEEEEDTTEKAMREAHEAYEEALREAKEAGASEDELIQAYNRGTDPLEEWTEEETTEEETTEEETTEGETDQEQEEWNSISQETRDGIARSTAEWIAEVYTDEAESAAHEAEEAEKKAMKALNLLTYAVAQWYGATGGEGRPAEAGATDVLGDNNYEDLENEARQAATKALQAAKEANDTLRQARESQRAITERTGSEITADLTEAEKAAERANQAAGMATKWAQDAATLAGILTRADEERKEDSEEA